MPLRGEQHELAKLTTRAVLRMRRKRARYGTPYADLGAEFGVSHDVAFGVCTGKRWPHVGGPIAGPSKVGRRPTA